MTENIESIIAQYGLIALFVGCFLEGETAALTGGVLAHRGLLGFGSVAVVVTLGAWTSDQFFFWIGRRHRDHALVKRLSRRRGVSHILDMVALRPLWVTAIYRFIPGMRILVPLALSQSPMRWLPYGAVTLVTCSIWALFYTGMGRAIGTLIARLYGQRHRVDLLVVTVSLIILVMLVLTISRIVSRRGGSDSDGDGPEA